MARPIEPTPALDGEDAQRLASDLEKGCDAREWERRVAEAKRTHHELLGKEVEMSKVSVTYDSDGDVLYVKRIGATIENSSPIEGDDFVVIDFDSDGNQVGLQVLLASEMSMLRWVECFLRDIEKPLSDAVANWLLAYGQVDQGAVRILRRTGVI